MSSKSSQEKNSSSSNHGNSKETKDDLVSEPDEGWKKYQSDILAYFRDQDEDEDDVVLERQSLLPKMTDYNDEYEYQQRYRQQNYQSNNKQSVSYGTQEKLDKALQLMANSV